MKHKRDADNMSYLERRDRNGCYGCLWILAFIVACSIVFTVASF